MGCEGVYVDPVMMRTSDDGRLVDGEPVTATCPGPPSSSSVGGTDSGDIYRRANTFVLAGRL